MVPPIPPSFKDDEGESPSSLPHDHAFMVHVVMKLSLKGMVIK